MRGEDKDNRRNDDTKNPEKSVDAAVEGSGVGIGFGWHNIWKIKNAFGPRMTHKCAGVFAARIR